MQSNLWRVRSEKVSRAERDGPFGREKIDPERAGSVRSARCPLSGACNRARRRRPGRLRYRILCGRLLAVNLCGILQRCCQHCSTPAHGATACAASGCIDRHYAAPEFTDSGQRRFSTQISTPKRQRGGIEMSYLLVTAVNLSGRPWCVTSLPSWSCGFDSRRPLQFVAFF